MSIVEVQNVFKTYAGGLQALTDVSLSIKQGEVLALLGPNGAGKTTLIGSICGIVEPTDGSIMVAGHDTKLDYKEARLKIGLVPQELYLDAFTTVLEMLRYTRGYFGKAQDEQLYEQILRDLSIWEKRDTQTRKLSGGMKRRLLIARALVSEPEILFLDEPTAGVDVELRRQLMDMVQSLNKAGMTIVLTTHYLEEADRLADRVVIINNGKVELVEDKASLLERFGGKSLEEVYMQLIKK